ncbi:Uma2 family endonuclease [Pseudonocardia sp. GCM10023141]|uniref:Uma2 family endonuclease n=1 Tax=Pseudonocardia sp. GCM10023141 TaxID=3252653 RepID=UPI00360FC229
MDLPVLDHEGPWTEAAFLSLLPVSAPQGASRIELSDGSLVIGPGCGPARAVAVARARAAVAAALPDGLRVIGPVPLRLGPDCVLVPDLVVTRIRPDAADAEDAAEVIIDAGAALIVVEVVGREHGITDRAFKPQLYARSRIPYSVLIDHDHPFAAAHMIISGRYHEYARAAAGERLVLEEPFPLEIDLDALARQDGPVSAAG